MKTTLLIMAAGIGSRFGGGIKQLEPVGPNGEIIMDYSIHDALEAGFDKLVFIIRKDIEKDFYEVIGKRMKALCERRGVEIAYAYQDLHDLPAGCTLPEGRTKPWGTGQAILAARDVIHEPFAVINADDYYGPESFQVIFDYLSGIQNGDVYPFAMVGFRLCNTLSENGYVSRGVCREDEKGNLVDVTERTHIEPFEQQARYTEDDGKTWKSLEADTTVSMNMWGFTPDILQEIEAGFGAFFGGAVAANPVKAEYYLPAVVNRLLEEHKATVRVLKSNDKWYGVTYKEDKASVTQALAQKSESGLYPAPLWG